MFKGIVYKITNKINLKVYIGQSYRTNLKLDSSKLLEDRIKKHLYKAKENKTKNINHHFSNALNKYSINNFEYEVLICCLNIEELNLKEEYYIKLYNSFIEGYNSTTGGNNYIVSEECKKERGKLASKIMQTRLSNPVEKEKMTAHYFNVLSKLENRRKNAESIKRTANKPENKLLRGNISKKTWNQYSIEDKKLRLSKAFHNKKSKDLSKQKIREYHYKEFLVLENGVEVNSFLLLCDCATYYNVGASTVKSHLMKRYNCLFLGKYTLEYRE